MITPYYICDKTKYCAKDGGCGGDMCNHTCDIHFVKNEESIGIFEEFIKTFELHVDEDMSIYAVEKENK